MSIIKPFRALRPIPAKVTQVASPPYDVLNSDEARKIASDNILSFLHVVKPEIDLPRDTDPYSDQVYQAGAANLKRFETEGVMIRDQKPYLYLYQQSMDIDGKQHVQTGLVAGASVAEYDEGLIKKHELTRAVKEADRTRHVETLNANTGPVFLTYKSDLKINELVEQQCKNEPVYDFVADDGIGHRVWIVVDRAAIAAFTEAFAGISHTYVADGHHRSASGASVGRKRRTENPNNTGQEEYNFFLSVFFPHDQLYIMDYNRVVLDLNKLSSKDFLAKISDKFEVSLTDKPSPEKATEFGMYLENRWYKLTAKQGSFDANNPVESLDVAILQNNLLAPILGIGDPRVDNRIDFIGGIRGTKELERRVEEGCAVAFAMYATSIGQLMAIADAGEIMPPKSTWFEPKLRSGLIVRPLD